jgi:hypothetical protein
MGSFDFNGGRSNNAQVYDIPALPIMSVSFAVALDYSAGSELRRSWIALPYPFSPCCSSPTTRVIGREIVCTLRIDSIPRTSNTVACFWSQESSDCLAINHLLRALRVTSALNFDRRSGFVEALQIVRC